MFISGYSSNRFLTCALKSFWGYILSNRYARQHICAYSLLGRTWVLSIQFPLALIDNCGICGNRRFQTRAWWARQFRRITIHFIQLSKTWCCGRLYSRAIYCLTRLSFRLHNSLDNVPKDAISSVFHTGGTSGELYFLKCSWMKSSFERWTSLFMVVKLSAYIILLMQRLESANQKGPWERATWCITFERSDTSILWIAVKRRLRSFLSK